MVKRLARLHALTGFVVCLLGIIPAQASPLVADPSVLASTYPDFRLNESLLGADAGQAHNGTGLHSLTSSSAATHAGQVPASILQLDQSVAHVILADLRDHRLYLLENQASGSLRVLRKMYATIGKNGSGKQIQDDGRTPVGIYTITRRLKDRNLPELYGSGAFPVDYPNRWDKWHQRTGYGIWVHGVPRNNYSRAPRSSEGCVAVGNADLDSLKPFMQPGNTRVVFSDQVQWLQPAQLAEQRSHFQARIEAWRQAWASLDTSAYLAFYGPEFSTPGMSRSQFVAHKKNVNAGKRYIKLELENVNLFNYPDGDNIRLVEFTQHYFSDNYNSVDRKQQYWKRADDGQWYILREATIDG